MRVVFNSVIFLSFALQYVTNELTTSSAATPSGGPLICNPTSFMLNMPDDFFHYDKTQKINITNNRDEECSKSPQYVWTVYQLNSDQQPNQITSIKINHVLDFEGPSEKSENILSLSKADASIDFYRYEFEMSVLLIPAPGWNPWHRNKTFRVQPYEMNITIAGGANREHNIENGNLILDASASSDASYRDNGRESMSKNTIVWKCTPSIPGHVSQSLVWNISEDSLKDLTVLSCSVAVTREGTPFYKETRIARQIITIIALKPTIEILCTDNCDPSDAFKNTTLRFRCWRNCRKIKKKWTFEPHNKTVLEKFVSHKDDYITFLANAFRPGAVITIKAYMADAISSTTLYYRMPAPKLTLECLENCEYEPRLETIISLTCEDDCENPDFKWEVSGSGLNPMGWLSPDKMKMKIKPNEFKDGETVVITVTSYNSVAKLEMNFKEEIPKLSLTCRIINANQTHCDQSEMDPRDLITLTVNCAENCKNVNYTWTVDPEASAFKIEENLNSPNHDQLTIPANSFSNQQNLMVTLASGKTTLTFNTTFRIKTPKLEIECIDNCENPGNILAETHLEAKCTENCNHLDYMWSVNNESPSKVKIWTQESNILIIPAGNLIDGENNFVLTSGDGSATLSRLFEEPIPVLHIRCEANCYSPNPAKETILKVICTSEPIALCQNQYQWDMSPLPPNFSWIEKTTISEQQTILKIKPFTFGDDDTIEFKVTDGRRAQATFTLSYEAAIPTLSIVCENNCDPSHPDYPTQLKVKCEPNCQELYEWTLEPKPAKPIKNLEKTGETIEISSGAYEDGTTVSVNVKSGRGSANLAITYKSLPPVLLLSCLPKCETIHHPMELIVVNATCSTYCAKSFDYTWTITPSDEFEYEKEKIIFQKNKDSFIILPDAFADGQNVKVTVSSDPESEISVNLVFAETPPILDIICVSNCWESTPLDNVVLEADCLDYCDNVILYKWELLEDPTDWSSNIILGPKNATIQIKPETYKDSDTVNVTLLARNGKKTEQLKFIELPAVLILSCVSNCDPSNPYENVILEVNCTKYCFKTEYEWDIIEPEPENWNLLSNAHLNRKKTTMTILKGFFKDGAAHRFFVKSRKGVAHIDVNFVVPPAELKLFCVSECNPAADPLNDTVIQATCLKYCYDDYKWSLIPMATNLNLNETKGVNNTLIIAGGLYPDQGSVRVTISTSNSQAFIDVYFSEPTPLLKLTCENCKESSIGVDDAGSEIKILNPFDDAKFNVTCLNNCQHLKYTWDFSPSSDKIVYNENNKNVTVIIPKMTFEDKQKILVTVRSGKGKDEMMVIYKTPSAYISIQCANNNCPYSNPLKPVVLKITCFYDCTDHEWQWNIEPRDPNFNWTKKIQLDDKNETLTILPEAFAHGQVIQLYAWSDENLKNQTVIKFEEPMPNITIVCVKNCRPFNSRRDLVLEAKCFENCASLTYEWTLEPISRHVQLANNTSKSFQIKAGSYYFNDTVVVSLKVRSAMSNMTIAFAPAGWDGVCDFEPKSGISGVTLFAIECDYFQEGVTYRIYQDYPNMMENENMGVLLAYGKNKFSDFFHLSAGKTVVTVAVGNGFENKKKIPLKFGTIQSLPEAKNYKLLKKILNDFAEMVNSETNTHKIVQFASLLWTALEKTGTENLAHYGKHIMAGINKVSQRIEPTQLLSLYSKFATKSPTDILTIRLMTEGIRASVDRGVLLKNQQAYQENQVFTNFCNETLSLLSRLMTLTISLHQKQFNPPASPDYEFKIDFETTHADFRRHLRKFTHHLLATTENLPNIMNIKNETNSKLINLKVGEILAKDAKKMEKLKITGSKSYITMSLKFGHIMQEMNETFNYSMGFFAADPFGWQNLEINTDVIQFSSTFLPAPMSVNLNLKKTAQPANISGLIEGKQILHEFLLRRKSMFLITFSKLNNAYHVRIPPKVPSTLINSTETITYMTDEETSIYVVISAINKTSTTNYTAVYKMLECFSWPTGDLSPSKDNCTVSQPNEDFITCECFHLSHYAGKLSIPMMRNQTNETIRSIGSITYPFILPASLIISLTIFLSLLIWAFFHDASNKNEIIFLADNQPGDKELYLIVVASGLTTGTTSDVAIELTGSEGKSRIHLLRGEKIKPLLQRNSEHFFAMFTEKNLGILSSIRLWTNNKGSKPHWYCERVMIEHLPSRRKYHFRIEQWFSLLVGNGITHGTFPANRKQNLTFPEKFRETLRENNHLLAFFTQRPRNLTKEIIIIGYATCSVIMLANLILTIYAPQIPIIATAALSALVTIPITWILNNLFRNSP